MFLLAVKPALPLTALQLRHLQRPCWGPTEPEGQKRWHVYSCLGQSLSKWHFITKSRLLVDRYGGREGKKKPRQKSKALVAAPWGCIIHRAYNLKVSKLAVFRANSCWIYKKRVFPHGSMNMLRKCHNSASTNFFTILSLDVLKKLFISAFLVHKWSIWPDVGTTGKVRVVTRNIRSALPAKMNFCSNIFYSIQYICCGFMLPAVQRFCFE